jgi:hypothetical protein
MSEMVWGEQKGRLRRESTFNFVYPKQKQSPRPLNSSRLPL